MGITDYIRDKIEDATDYIGKNITGTYQHYVNCKYCGVAIDTKYGIGDNFICDECNIVLCYDCMHENVLIEEIVLQNPALFKKGRRYYKLGCPNCGTIVGETDIETFR